MKVLISLGILLLCMSLISKDSIIYNTESKNNLGLLLSDHDTTKPYRLVKPVCDKANTDYDKLACDCFSNSEVSVSEAVKIAALNNYFVIKNANRKPIVTMKSLNDKCAWFISSEEPHYSTKKYWSVTKNIWIDSKSGEVLKKSAKSSKKEKHLEKL